MKFLPDSPTVYWAMRGMKKVKRAGGKRRRPKTTLSDNLQAAAKQWIAAR